MKYETMTVTLPKLPSVFAALTQLINREFLTQCCKCHREMALPMEWLIRFHNNMEGNILSRPETEEDLDLIREGKPAGAVLRDYHGDERSMIVCQCGERHWLDELDIQDAPNAQA